MFLAAAQALAGATSEALLESGQIYPDISDVREVSKIVAIAVAQQAVSEGLAEPVDDIEAVVTAHMWNPEYLPYRTE